MTRISKRATYELSATIPNGLSPVGALKSKGLQAPLVHVPPRQLCPHAPQLAGSVCSFVHTVLQIEQVNCAVTCVVAALSVT